MSENVEVGLKQWENVSSDELGYTFPGLQIATTRYNNEYGQQFNVLDVDARRTENDPTIVTTASYDYRIDPLMERRMSILAKHANARVLFSELPGVTMDRDDPMHTKGDYQTIKQTVLAFSGNFDPLAIEQLKAIDSIAEFKEGEEIQLLGHSLSAYSVTAMARVLARGNFNKSLAVTRMDLIEPINAYGNHSINRQIKMYSQLATVEDQRRQLYLQENVAIGHGDIGAYEKISPFTARVDKYIKRRQAIAIYAGGAGLRKGLHTALKDALNASPELRDVKITLSRGIDSTASFEKDLQSAADTIRENSGNAETISMIAEEGDNTPIGHSVLDSLGRLASYTEARQRDIDRQTLSGH